VAAWGVIGALCATARAQEGHAVPRVLLDRRLNERTVQLIDVSDSKIKYTESTSRESLERNEPISEYLAVLSPVSEEHEAAVHPVSLVELTDGERFVGSLVTHETKPDSIMWEHVSLGVMEFKLDSIKRIQFQGGPEQHRDPGAAADLVVLANGDKVEGFVDSVGPTVQLEVNGSKRDLPVARVQEIDFAAGPAQEVKGGMVAWLRDGSVVACRSIHTTRLGELVLSPRVMGAEERQTEAPAPLVTLRLDDLWALSLDPSGTVPLASLPIASQTPGPDRRWAKNAVAVDARWAALGLADIELPGPMTVEWNLPTGASRFAAEAELPRQMWTWGDCELVVLTAGAGGGETEIWRRRINAEAARARIAVALPDPGAKRALRIRLEAGEYGSVQDKIVLHRPVLLVEKK
jgi:hypothetical protein